MAGFGDDASFDALPPPNAALERVRVSGREIPLEVRYDASLLSGRRHCAF